MAGGSEFKVSLGYIASSKPDWPTGEAGDRLSTESNSMVNRICNQQAKFQNTIYKYFPKRKNCLQVGEQMGNLNGDMKAIKWEFWTQSS